MMTENALFIGRALAASRILSLASNQRIVKPCCWPVQERMRAISSRIPRGLLSGLLFDEQVKPNFESIKAQLA